MHTDALTGPAGFLRRGTADRAPSNDLREATSTGILGECVSGQPPSRGRGRRDDCGRSFPMARRTSPIRSCTCRARDSVRRHHPWRPPGRSRDTGCVQRRGLSASWQRSASDLVEALGRRSMETSYRSAVRGHPIDPRPLRDRTSHRRPVGHRVLSHCETRRDKCAGPARFRHRVGGPCRLGGVLSVPEAARNRRSVACGSRPGPDF